MAGWADQATPFDGLPLLSSAVLAQRGCRPPRRYSLDLTVGRDVVVR
jgi:hypothetical protein